MFSWIKNYLANRKAKEEERKKQWAAYWDFLFSRGELGIVLDILGMPHNANSLCDKCAHLAGRTIDKELLLEMFRLHNIKLPNNNDR